MGGFWPRIYIVKKGQYYCLLPVLLPLPAASCQWSLLPTRATGDWVVVLGVGVDDVDMWMWMWMWI
jgi:hypothetical protein